MRALRHTAWVVTVLYWGLICVLTHLSPRDVPHVSINDKLVHFLMYGGFGFLLGLALHFSGVRRWIFLLVLLIALAYGAIDEWTQPIFGRTCDLFDWLADAGGALSAVALLFLLLRITRRSAPI